MTETESSIYDFIVKDVLRGRGEGLEVDTPLLDLNILDSFRIMTVLAYIEEELGVMIAPEELDKKAFNSIRSISALVDSQRSLA